MLMTVRARLAAATSCCALIAALAPCGARAQTLGDAITLAYQTNPTLQGQRAALRAVDEEDVQARAGFRPTVSVNASVVHDDNNDRLAAGSFFFTPVAVIDSSSAAITFDQPIYTGGRATTALKAADADIMAGREELRRIENQVLENVVQAYLDVRRDQEQLAIGVDNANVLRRQLDETNARFSAGEVTRTDVAQAEARLAAGEAQVSSAQATLAIARATYAAIVGENPGELAAEPPISGLLPADVDAAFAAAERSNPVLREAVYTEQASAARVAEAKAQTRPQADVRMSYGLNGGGENPLTGAYIPPFNDYTHDITVSANLTVPLFTGGMTTSQIRQAGERNNVDRIGIEAARRQVLQAVSQAWNQLLGARANLVNNQEQVRASTVAYEGTRQEEQVGLRTTLDVLNAQQELENAELALVGARHDEYLASAAVLAAMGSLEAKDLIPGVPRYDPAANTRKIRHAPGWVAYEPIVEALDHIGAPRAPGLPAQTPPGQVVSP